MVQQDPSSLLLSDDEICRQKLLSSEVFELNSANASSVVKATKEAFSRHGIPETVISDSGSQCSSKQCKQFAPEWPFSHKTSSLRYPQSNGLAESFVKVVKQLLKKSKCSKQGIRKAY